MATSSAVTSTPATTPALVPFAFGLSGPATQPRRKQAKTTENTTVVVLINFEPIVIEEDAISSENFGQMLHYACGCLLYYK